MSTEFKSHAGPFHALLRQWSVSRKPANVVADAATDVDHTQWSGNVLAADRRNHRTQQFVHPCCVLELFGEPLHFTVHGHEQAIDGFSVRQPVALRKCFDPLAVLAGSRICGTLPEPVACTREDLRVSADRAARSDP
jgi:hypothetical protein